MTKEEVGLLLKTYPWEHPFVGTQALTSTPMGSPAKPHTGTA